MATWIKVLGGRQNVTPANGKSFKLAELQNMVGGYIEAVRLDGDQVVMWVNEEGKLKGLPVNPEATRVVSFLAAMSGRRCDDPIVGDVVIATKAESGEDDEDEGGDE